MTLIGIAITLQAELGPRGIRDLIAVSPWAVLHLIRPRRMR